MPKILEDVRAQLLAEARRQTAELGYAKTTIRSVADNCGVAVGTVYNYFPSKESLIASVLAEDWERSLAELRAAAPCGAEARLRAICEALTAFTQRYGSLFSDPDAAKAASGVLPMRHLQLRDQLAELVAPLCGGEDDPFAARFVAEALLTWTMAGVPFERLYPMIKKLITEREESS